MSVAPPSGQNRIIDRLLRARLWKLYEEGQFGRLRGGRGGAVEYMKQLEPPDE